MCINFQLIFSLIDFSPQRYLDKYIDQWALFTWDFLDLDLDGTAGVGDLGVFLGGVVDLERLGAELVVHMTGLGADVNGWLAGSLGDGEVLVPNGGSCKRESNQSQRKIN